MAQVKHRSRPFLLLWRELGRWEVRALSWLLAIAVVSLGCATAAHDPPDSSNARDCPLLHDAVLHALKDADSRVDESVVLLPEGMCAGEQSVPTRLDILLTVEREAARSLRAAVHLDREERYGIRWRIRSGGDGWSVRALAIDPNGVDYVALEGRVPAHEVGALWATINGVARVQARHGDLVAPSTWPFGGNRFMSAWMRPGLLGAPATWMNTRDRILPSEGLPDLEFCKDRAVLRLLRERMLGVELTRASATPWLNFAREALSPGGLSLGVDDDRAAAAAVRTASSLIAVIRVMGDRSDLSLLHGFMEREGHNSDGSERGGVRSYVDRASKGIDRRERAGDL